MQGSSRNFFIYIASKTCHADKWLALRDSGIPIGCTWIDEAAPGATASYEDLWKRCVREASTAVGLIVYAEEGEILKGALIEVGAALAHHKPVFVVGPQKGWSFMAHPLVRTAETVEGAIHSLIAERF